MFASMEKKCTKCNQTKSIDRFFKRLDRPSGYKSQCKDCSNKDFQRRKKDPNSYYYKRVNSRSYYVYLLLNEDYVGITKSLEQRRAQHRLSGKNSIDMQVIGEFDNPYDALMEEAYLHKLGFKGCQYADTHYGN